MKKLMNVAMVVVLTAILLAIAVFAPRGTGIETDYFQRVAQTGGAK